MTIQHSGVVVVWLRDIPACQGIEEKQEPSVRGKVITKDDVAITLDKGAGFDRIVVIPWANVSLVEVLPSDVHDLLDD